MSACLDEAVDGRLDAVQQEALARVLRRLLLRPQGPRRTGGLAITACRGRKVYMRLEPPIEYRGMCLGIGNI